MSRWEDYESALQLIYVKKPTVCLFFTCNHAQFPFSSHWYPADYFPSIRLDCWCSVPCLIELVVSYHSMGKSLQRFYSFK